MWCAFEYRWNFPEVPDCNPKRYPFLLYRNINQRRLGKNTVALLNVLPSLPSLFSFPSYP